MSKLDQLIADVEVLKREADAATARLREAEEALLQERFHDVERYQEGDIVLVPRKLFGEHKMWPAKIREVHLHYTSGRYQTGEPFESRTVTYMVYLRGKDGTFSGSSDSFYHSDVKPLTASD